MGIAGLQALIRLLLKYCLSAIEGHCNRSKADHYSVRSHETLAPPLRGLAWLLSRGSHLLFTAMALSGLEKCYANRIVEDGGNEAEIVACYASRLVTNMTRMAIGARYLIKK